MVPRDREALLHLARALSKEMNVKVVCERVTEVISAPILSKCRLVE